MEAAKMVLNARAEQLSIVAGPKVVGFGFSCAKFSFMYRYRRRPTHQKAEL
jgi:hypothetical protein